MRKPPKPRIAKKHLKWVFNRRKGDWEPHHRVTWLEAGKRRERTILLDWQGDSRTLDDLYWDCEAGRHERQKPAAPRYSWGNAIREWRADPRVQGRLAESTKKSYGRDMDALLEKNDAKDMRRTNRQDLRASHAAMADTTRKADKRLAVVSLLWNYAAEQLDWPIGPNPAKGIKPYGKQRGFEPWPVWMVAKLEDAPDIVRTTAELILGTGQRPGAAIEMRHDHFNDEWMTVTDEKGNESFEVFCPQSLRAYLALRPRKGAYVLAKNLREPLGYDAVEKAFRAWRKDLGEKAKPFSLHGLRKLAIIRLAEAGCSDAEIQAVTNQSAEMVAYYRSRASRKALSKQAQERQ